MPEGVAGTLSTISAPCEFSRSAPEPLSSAIRLAVQNQAATEHGTCALLSQM